MDENWISNIRAKKKMSHIKNIVKKPWGYEYLMYENDQVALWFLYIKDGERTSMHCHPSKTTGLTLLDGKIEVSFLSDKNILNPSSKIMIRKGLFHSTKSINSGGSYVLEIETPVDKKDLVRFQDSYGREGKPYEDSTFEYPKENDCIWIEEPEEGKNIIYKIGNATIDIQNVNDIDFFNNFEHDKNIMFLKGGIVTEYGVNVAAAGDIVNTSVLKKLIKVFTKIKHNTIVMVIG